MYHVIEQNVTEARQKFTETLKKFAAAGDRELAVLVQKRGEPLAAIISAAEFARYRQWKADHDRAQDGAGDQGERPQAVSQALPSDSVPEREEQEPQNVPPPTGVTPHPSPRSGGLQKSARRLLSNEDIAQARRIKHRVKEPRRVIVNIARKEGRWK